MSPFPTPELVFSTQRLLLAAKEYFPARAVERPQFVEATDRLSKRLIDGDFQPGRNRIFTIPKADGTRRQLTVPALGNRVAQRAILMEAESRAERILRPSCLAFRPHRGCHSALERVRLAMINDAWVVRTDVYHCFESIHCDLALSGWRRLDDADAYSDRVRSYVFSPYPRTSGLPQGAPLSPLLCNLVLHPVDVIMEQECHWTRYADDLVAICPNRPMAEAVMRRLQDRLGELGLRLGEEKTAIQPTLDGLHFLGQWIVPNRVAPAPSPRQTHLSAWELLDHLSRRRRRTAAESW